MTITNITIRAFTTFEVGKICGVYHTTVINWVNKGMLKAKATPGGHRRIFLPDLVEFMRRFDMPVPADLHSRPKRVLVVEDDPAVSRMLLRTLEGLPGLFVSACSSGLEALMAIGKEAPDLLLLDIRIPQVNGYEVCRVLKANELTRPVKVVAVTGEALTEEEERFLSENADCFFRKPLSTEELRAKVSQLLDLEAVPQAAAT